MKRLVLSIATVLLSFPNISGQTKAYFPGLTRISIDTTYNVYFGYDKTTSRFTNTPCHLLNKKDPLYCEFPDSMLETWSLVAKYKSKAFKDSLNIVYSQGMSADPGFVVATKGGRILDTFSCLEFYINSSGTIYTSGHVNSMYNRRRKFQIQVDTILEVQQPYYYVGMKGKSLKDITLFKDRVGNDIVAQVPKDNEIEILLAYGTKKDFEADNLFLVKTDFGIVGWLRLEGYEDQVLEDLYYKGD